MCSSDLKNTQMQKRTRMFTFSFTTLFRIGHNLHEASSLPFVVVLCLIESNYLIVIGFYEKLPIEELRPNLDSVPGSLRCTRFSRLGPAGIRTIFAGCSCYVTNCISNQIVVVEHWMHCYDSVSASDLVDGYSMRPARP